ncbi:hypothetical protein PR048_000144 [Dryococelus australis]|uniref:C2H2-type domain-containing protein n=1 Tax=Dryococelus australis TaxID=614101 RepID=A0ABQ9IDS9_9NEOP|nr:hypothetical protein PR048_000144 [Dryococelus australis]
MGQRSTLSSGKPQRDNRVNQEKTLEGLANNLFFCPSCPKNYFNKNSLVKHMKLVCGVEPQFGCPYCPQRFTQMFSVKRHVLKQHGVAYP